LKLTTALDEFGLLQRRRHRGEEAQLTALALAALREYLADYAGIETTEALSPNDLYSFILEYYPSQEEPDALVATALLEVCSAFALWLLERDERALAPFAAVAERLREDLPRVMAALAVLRDHVAEADLTSPVELTEEGEEEPAATVGTGLDRMVRLDQVDYAAAQMDYFTIRRVAPGSLALESSGREALNEGLAEPVAIPAAASEHLRVGDLFYAEIAPGPNGWEVLDIFGIRPGGYE